MTSFGTKPAVPQHMPPVQNRALPVPAGPPDVAAYQYQQAVAQDYQAQRAAIPEGVAPDELRDNAGVYQFSDQALGLKPMLDAVKADAEAAQQRVAAAVNSIAVPDDKSDQARRIWDRTRYRLVAAGDKKVAVAQDLIKNAEGLTLATLKEDLPDFLNAVGAPTDWVDGAIAQRVPEAAAATSDAILKARQAAILAQNHAMLTRAIANDVAPQPLLSPANVTATPYLDYSE